MKKSINKFNKQALDNKATQEIKGGTTFCEWYVGYCGDCGIEANPDDMALMMQYDQWYNNSIPRGWKDKQLEMIITYN